MFHGEYVKRTRSSAAWFAAIVCLGAGLSAQVITASLSIEVRDPSGAAVAEAAVKVVNTSTNVAVDLKSAGEGRYLAASLPPGGPYSVIVSANGFKRAERTGITLEVNQQASLDIQLALGQSSDTVTVNAESALIDANSAATGQVIDNRAIVNLPLNQRNAYSLVFLTPGVVGNVGTQYNSANISINGGRPGSADILVDGIPSSPNLVNPIQGFAVFPSVDAVQEFKVQSSNYSAEFGRSGGGIINLIYKSGTNILHGSVFEFLRNSALDANDFFSNRNGRALASFKRNQYGVSASGPVFLPKIYNGHDKTFFLFAYEGLRQKSASPLTSAVPSALQRQGDFSQTVTAAGAPVTIYDPATTTASGSGFVRQPFPGNAIPASRIDPVARNIIKYYPVQNTATAIPGANNFFAPGSAVINTDQLDAKVDENINEHNRFFVRYSRRQLDQPNPVYFPTDIVVAEGGINQPQVSASAAFDYTYTPSPTWVIDFRYGFARTAINFTPQSDGFDPAQLGFPAYLGKSADRLMFPGIAAQSYLALGNGGPDYRHNSFENQSWTLSATKALSRHTVKFGFDGRLLLVNDRESSATDGTFSFTNAITQGPNPNAASANAGNGIASLLLGVGSGSLVLQSKNAATSSTFYSWYAADDWKVNNRLTINVGLRYEIDVPRQERYGRMVVFDPSAANVAGYQGGLQFIAPRARQFETPLKDFAPRFGFTYQLTPKTVVRGGYGIFYAGSYRAAAGTVGNVGFNSTTQYVGSVDGLTPSAYLSNPFPSGFIPISGNTLGVKTGLGSTVTAPLRGDNRIPYTQNWSFGIQRELPGRLVVEGSYVGNHAIHLTQTGEADVNANQLSPQALARGTALQQKVANPFFGLITAGALAAATVPASYLAAPFPQFTSVYESFLTGGYSLYHSMQLKAEKRLSGGISFLASFTGQKLIDNYSITSNVGKNAGIQNIYNIAGERAVSANDVSRIFVLSSVYELPFGRGRRFGAAMNRWEDLAIGGWQVNGIVTVQSGFPLALTAPNTSNSGNGTERPNNNGTSAALSGSVESRLNRYFDTSVFSQPLPFTFGNTGRTLPDVRQPGTRNLDFSMFKNFHLVERVSMQFRAEAFNLLNHPIFGAPGTTFGSPAFGVISSQANSPRQIQFGLKILF